MIRGGELDYVWPEFLARHAIMHRPEIDAHCVKIQAITLVRFAEKGVYYLTKLVSDMELEFPWHMPNDEQKIQELEGMSNVIQALGRKVAVCQMMVEVDGLLEDEEGDPMHQIDSNQQGEDERLKFKYLYQPAKADPF